VHFEHQTIENTALPATCTDFSENIDNFRNLVVSLRRLQSKLANPTDNGRTDHFNEFKRGNIVHLR
jgi:hypothetical protein